MTFEEWRKTRQWHDVLPKDMRSNADQTCIPAGFTYNNNNCWIEQDALGWYTMALEESYSALNLKEAEYFLWTKLVAPLSSTQFDECTITWFELMACSCSTALPRGLDDEAAFNAIQEAIANDRDVEKEDLGVVNKVLNTITWE